MARSQLPRQQLLRAEIAAQILEVVAGMGQGGDDEAAPGEKLGGVVVRAENRTALTDDASYVVWLSASVDVLTQRVVNGAHRPLLDDDPRAALERLDAVRNPLYREVADGIVSVVSRSPNDVVQAVMRCCA